MIVQHAGVPAKLTRPLEETPAGHEDLVQHNQRLMKITAALKIAGKLTDNSINKQQPDNRQVSFNSGFITCPWAQRNLSY